MDVKESRALDPVSEQRQTGDQIAVMLPGVQL